MPTAHAPLASASAVGGASIDVSIAVWAGFGLLVVAMLAVDLLVFARRRVPSARESAAWSIGWLAVAAAFGVGWWAWQGAEAGSEFAAGYLLERSLSLDNVFVLAVILGYFAVPAAIAPKVLSWGIMLALVLRLALIVVGAALIDAFDATFYLFGALLLYTAYKLARHDDIEVDPEHNPALRLLRRHTSMTEGYEGDRLVVRRDGRRMVTPLMAVLLVVATTDVIFAVDSVPAIFGVTRESFIVFAANAFAMLGMRALYFLLATMMGRFVYLSYGLAAVLGFVGAKMLLIDLWHPPIWVSLSVIVGVLGLTILLSLRSTIPARSET